MDNELKIFLQSFKELENLFQALPITETQIQHLKGFVSGILKNAKSLALYDAITHALNARAGKWLMPDDQIKGMAKVDIYDLRQANKVYGASVVDKELHKLAFQFMSILPWTRVILFVEPRGAMNSGYFPLRKRLMK